MDLTDKNLYKRLSPSFSARYEKYAENILFSKQFKTVQNFSQYLSPHSIKVIVQFFSNLSLISDKFKISIDRVQYLKLNIEFKNQLTKPEKIGHSFEKLATLYKP